jgi:glucosylceramidase
MNYLHRICSYSLTLFIGIGLLVGCKTATSAEIVSDQQASSTTLVNSEVKFWNTTSDQTVLFKRQNIALNFNDQPKGYVNITVDTTQTFQTMDGFGFALTGGSATLINSLESTQKEALLKELFLTDSTYIGTSYLRISLGASDLSSEPFTYDEIGGTQQRDDNLEHFSMDKEVADLIPVLQKIVALNPSIKIIATPWTAPTWMKTNKSFVGGSLRADCYDVYARYFVKYLKAMKDAGITIDAITPQNEPLNAYNNPAMLMTAAEEANFIKNYLGPQLRASNPNTKIIIYDHNLDRADYPISVLSDQDANAYVDGSAFHLYAGNIETLSTVHTSFPSKNLYFTEQYTASTGTFSTDLQWHIQNLIIGASRNWSRNVIEWNLASNSSLGPHTSGGCSTCLGALTIGSSVSRNVSYYVIAHAAKFVRPGSVRIASDINGGLQNVAFKTPNGKKVLIVLNSNSVSTTFNIHFNGKYVSPTLPAGSVGTFIW